MKQLGGNLMAKKENPVEVGMFAVIVIIALLCVDKYLGNNVVLTFIGQLF